MDTSFFVTILLCAGVTISVRALPIILLSRMEIPVMVREWLNFIPAAIMSAIIAAELLANPTYTQSGWSVSTLATLSCLAIGIWSRSLFLTVFSGIAAFMLFGWILP